VENHLDLVSNHLDSHGVDTLAVVLDMERLPAVAHNWDNHWVGNQLDLVGSWDDPGDHQVDHQENVMEDCGVREIQQDEDVERGLHCVVAVVRELGKVCGEGLDHLQLKLVDLMKSFECW